ncbi:MAG: phenylalanine--tRNA ligase subunit alpha [Nanoarchaeota archaeon]|nr:phenylalanine--tRNA ligase subunit alpha [Nanoarchaeota archaeon]MBU2459453.1 phenylalanine--tRNA ligase subunit alpha [Nanoarchaeota archaeon]
MEKNINKLLESLSPNERKILPHLDEKNIGEICKKSNLDRVSVTRSLEYLKDKGVLEIMTRKIKLISIGVNGALYIKKGLPERRLLNLLNEKRILKLSEAAKQSSLSEDEFKASLGMLKKRNLIDLKNGKIIFSGNKEEISRKSPEESFIESLPTEYDSLTEEQSETLKTLERRKDIVRVSEEKIIEIKITTLGKKIIDIGKEFRGLIEQITPEILKKESSWKGKKFRRYDVTLPVPKINGGRRHFVNQAIDYARDVWSEMGFKEMTGNYIMSSFWNFDALFQPQDHPAREMHDTFFIDKKLQNLDADKKTIENVKKSHEVGVVANGSRSTGWNYSWNEEEAKRLVLRTHTTCLSAQTLSKLARTPRGTLPQKFFAIGKCLRNETLDWSHGFEFNQTEGIVVDKNANFRHLLGYLKEFFKKMGYEKLRFRPAYFPYTEPSIEIDFWHPEKKVWLELGGAGMFRPEVVIPLLGENIPVLAWGPGFDRMIMSYYQIKDLRELYKNNLTQLRKMKFWMK